MANKPGARKENDVPIVNIMVTREGSTPEHSSVTPEEKRRLIKGVSELLLEVLNKPLDSTFVIIEEVELDNWGWGGMSVRELRRKTRPSVSPPAR
ncbi:MAG TPA: 4-oxalocrotonate tautomerase family protein [Allosphingosinicella sp.]|nr:4-oxalocrotonate tautomerase family protein [Allosphingosinicella sp.]